jgi:hypothetical protein
VKLAAGAAARSHLEQLSRSTLNYNHGRDNGREPEHHEHQAVTVATVLRMEHDAMRRAAVRLQSPLGGAFVL